MSSRSKIGNAIGRGYEINPPATSQKEKEESSTGRSLSFAPYQTLAAQNHEAIAQSKTNGEQTEATEQQTEATEQAEVIARAASATRV